MSSNAGLNQLLHHLLKALTFFTRLPVGKFSSERVLSEPLDKSAIAFPIVGLIIGLFTAVVWLITSLILPSTVAAMLTVCTGIFITGALHEDGLADCADGLGATKDKDKALEIMRDSANGTYGTLALIASFTLRVAALAALPPTFGVVALIASHTHARAIIAIALFSTHYARKKGAGSVVSAGISSTEFWQCIGTSILICAIAFLLVAQLQLVLSLIIGTIAAWLMLRYLIHRLGGYTGDGLGAMQQLCEITMMIAIASLV